MAKITDGTFKDWQETEIVHASDYTQEREMLRLAVNDNDERLGSIEDSIFGFQLGNAQLQKITDDTGGVTLTTTSTFDDILAIILAAGKGMRTFYAVSGSRNLPPTNVSIRGIAHFTSDTIGWVYATDYKNNIFTNYYDTTKWSGWKPVLSLEVSATTALNSRETTGLSWVSPNTINSPTANAGSLLIVSPGEGTALIQTFTDVVTNDVYTRTRFNGTFSNWDRQVAVSDTQDQLWSGGNFMTAAQTVTPIKKLSQCRNGWILMWSDYNTGVGGGPNNVNWVSTVVPKFMGANHNGNNWSERFSIGTTTGQADILATKEFTIFDDKIVGNANNDQGLSTDIVLRYVLEW